MNEGVHYQQRNKKGHFKKLNPVHEKYKTRIEAYMKGASPLPPDLAVRMVAKDLRFENERRKKHELSIEDSLTGLKNRRFVFGDESKPNPSGELRRLFLEAKREGKPLSVIMLDIDHFKNVNDKYGHDAGDLVLKQFSEVIKGKGVMRESDIIARIGGEEILVILPNTDLEGASLLAEKIREMVENKNLNSDNKENRPNKITISAGVSTFSRKSRKIKSEAALQAAADGALYFAKHAGRNQVGVTDEITLGKDKTIFHHRKALTTKEKFPRLRILLKGILLKRFR